jgi:hypothetical protein
MSQKLDAVQIYALAQHIAADPNLSRTYYIGNDLRAYEYNAQRGLTEVASRKFQQKFGKTPEQVLDEINRRPSLPATSAQAQNANTYDNLSGAVKIIDLGKQGQPQGQNPNTLVAVGCTGCGIRLSVTVAELEQYREAYCPKCLQKGIADNEAAQKAIVDFIREVPSFYPHEANIRLLGDECERRKITTPTIDHLTEIYAQVRSQMPFKRLTEAEGRAMTSQEWAAREKVDPGMGGLDLAKVKEGLNRGVEAIHSSNKTKTFYLPQQGHK